MDKPFCTYTLVKSPRDSFFIGANTEKGFRLSPGGIFDEKNYDGVFILKGGPGTGKSTFMKKIIKHAERAGANTKKYYCSSDPDSLDAITVVSDGKKYLVCDGTSPHVTEMNYPGAISKIVNLSTAWDSYMLAEKREEIITLSTEKSELFSSAYKYLLSAYEIHRSLLQIAERVCDTEKLENTVSRFSERYRKFKGEKREAYTEAFSMKGAVALDTFLRDASEIFYLSDSYCISELYLNILSRELELRGVGFYKILSPINSGVISGIYITGGKVLITHDNLDGKIPEGKIINTKRFLNGKEPEYRGRYRLAAKCCKALLEGAEENLSEAKKRHFALEEIYVPAMNFKKVDRLCRETVSEIFCKSRDNSDSK